MKLLIRYGLLCFSVVLTACEFGSHTIGGTVSGLSGGRLVLQNNNSDDESITQNGFYEFDTEADAGDSYYVTVKEQPVGQSCTVANASGDVSDGDVDNVVVNCSSNTIVLASASGIPRTFDGTWRKCIYNGVQSADEQMLWVVNYSAVSVTRSFFSSTDASCSGTELATPAPTVTMTLLTSLGDTIAVGWNNGISMEVPPLGGDGNPLADAPTITKLQGDSADGSITKFVRFVDDTAIPWRVYGNGIPPDAVSGCGIVDQFPSCLLSTEYFVQQ